jgi:hypothetical protein
MDLPDDYIAEPLASQYPDNVVEKFATAFSRLSAYDGPGYCTVSFSRQFTVVNCMSDLDMYKPVVTGIFLAFVIHTIITMIRSCCCSRK